MTDEERLAEYMRVMSSDDELDWGEMEQITKILHRLIYAEGVLVERGIYFHHVHNPITMEGINLALENGLIREDVYADGKSKCWLITQKGKGFFIEWMFKSLRGYMKGNTDENQSS